MLSADCCPTLGLAWFVAVLGAMGGRGAKKRPASAALQSPMARAPEETDENSSASESESGESVVRKERPNVDGPLPKGDPHGIPRVSGAELATELEAGSTVVCLGRSGKSYGRLLVRVDEAYEPSASGLWLEGNALEVSTGAKTWGAQLAGPGGPGVIHRCQRDEKACARTCSRAHTELIVHVPRGAVISSAVQDVRRRVLS